MNAGDEKLITEMLDALKQALPYIQAFRDSAGRYRSYQGTERHQQCGAGAHLPRPAVIPPEVVIWPIMVRPAKLAHSCR